MMFELFYNNPRTVLYTKRYVVCAWVRSQQIDEVITYMNECKSTILQLKHTHTHTQSERTVAGISGVRLDSHFSAVFLQVEQYFKALSGARMQ